MRPWALPFLLLLGACSTWQQVNISPPLYRYKADIKVTVDGKSFDGMAVTKLNGPKLIEIESKAALDLLTISSCHRQFTAERVDAKSGWFGRGSGHTYKYTYSPTEVEKEGFCPIYLQAFDRNGVVAWGYLAFRTEEELPSQMDCNGRQITFAGVSVCQSKAGLRQQISFAVPVKMKGSELCKVQAINDKTFRFSTEMGFCYATFTDGKNWHRMVLLGYDQVLVRGE